MQLRRVKGLYAKEVVANIVSFQVEEDDDGRRSGGFG